VQSATAILLTAALVAGAALVATPDAGLAQSVTVCRQNSAGFLFNPGGSNCGDTSFGPSTLLRFQTTGPRGPRGARGNRGQRGQRGELGEQGTIGATGRSGATGADGTLHTYTVTVAGDGTTTVSAQTGCDAGDVVTGGGFLTNGTIFASLGLAEEELEGWLVTAGVEDPDLEIGAKSHVVCVDNPPLRQ
jgi:hypothetical protein